MSTFEWAIIGLIIAGVVLPFWVMVALAFVVTRRKPRPIVTTPSRAREYAELMREFEHAFKKTAERKLDGPTLVACIRDLKAYPEYKDASIRLLEGINVNGNGVFVDMVKTEMRAVENHLLSVDPAETGLGNKEK